MSNTTSIKPTSSELLDTVPNTSPQSSHQSSLFSRFKKHIHDLKKEWGPCMAAKEHWQDEYTFAPGRYAGQGHKREI
ncbi:hypothetical protein N7522_006912 [Penicillium canescens]|nr:hypothetical protein N7522_006912 [Penicillium canescens]